MILNCFKKHDEKIKKYCLIRRNDERCGIGSYIITALGGILYSLDKGLIPVVDLNHGNNMYKEKESDNAWEYFFKQPSGIGLEDITDYDECVELESGELALRPKLTMDFLTNETALDFWQKITKRYISFSNETQEVVDNYLEEFLPLKDNNKTIGVLARGTDYKCLRPFGHPVQPSIDELKQIIKDMCERTGYRRVFLATEDQDIYDGLKDEFGENIISPNSERFKYENSIYLSDQLTSRSNVKMGREYIAALMVLANCKCLIAGRTSGSVVSKVFGGNYEHEYLFNSGSYGIDDAESLRRDYLEQ